MLKTHRRLFCMKRMRMDSNVHLQLLTTTVLWYIFNLLNLTQMTRLCPILRYWLITVVYLLLCRNSGVFWEFALELVYVCAHACIMMMKAMHLTAIIDLIGDDIRMDHIRVDHLQLVCFLEIWCQEDEDGQTQLAGGGSLDNEY